MDSPAVNGLFRRLATHRFCQQSRPLQSAVSHQQWRQNSSGRPATPKRTPPPPPAPRERPRKDVKTTSESNWQQRTDTFPEDRGEEFRKYPTVTADSLRTRKERPRRVKMLMRDFIEDSLYNPHYGYFSKNVSIFSSGEPFELDQGRA